MNPPGQPPLPARLVLPPKLSPTRAATGYSVILPPDWRQIPLRAGTDRAIRGVVKEAFAALPRAAPPDQVSPHRLRLERRLTQMAREARGRGGIDLYLPAGPVYGAPLAASFIVSELSLGTADPAGIVAILEAGDNAAKPAAVDGADGLRAERTAGPSPDRAADFASRLVDYVLPVPGRPGRWLAVAFSTLGGGSPDDDIAGLLTELFDAIMSTFRWGWENR